MSTRTTLKHTITEAVAKELPNELSEERSTPTDDLLFKWWQTGRGEGLRLTDYGDLAFRMAEIEFYQYDLATRPSDGYYSWVMELNKRKAQIHLSIWPTKLKRIVLDCLVQKQYSKKLLSLIRALVVRQ